MKDKVQSAPSHPSAWVYAAILGLVGWGCATPALWRSTAPREWHPSEARRVFRYVDTNQTEIVAVEFTQQVGYQTNAPRRSVIWCLNESPSNVVVGASQRCKFTNSISRVREIPLVTVAARESVNRLDEFAVWDMASRRVEIYREGRACQSAELPSTPERTRWGARLLGLPIAVAVDTAIVVTVAGAAVLLDPSNSVSFPEHL